MHFLLRKNCGAACGKGRRDALWTKKETPDFSRVLVEHSGFEPLTSTMRMSRATNCANAPNIVDEFFADSPLTARFFPLGLKPSGANYRLARSTNCANAPYSVRSRLRLSRTGSIIPHVSGFVNTFFRKKQIFLKVSFRRGLHAGRRLSVASIKSARRLRGESAAPQRYSRRAASFRRARQCPQPYRRPRRYSRQSA